MRQKTVEDAVVAKVFDDAATMSNRRSVSAEMLPNLNVGFLSYNMCEVECGLPSPSDWCD
ncbi:MAG: hypothetical protein AAF619_08945 [Pseudomonadota bacterium]